MKNYFALITLFCLAIFCLASPAYGQAPAAPNTDWDALQSIPIGQNLRVQLKTGGRSKRRLVAVSDTELTVKRKGRKAKIETIKREEISKVWRVDPPNRAKQVIFASIGGFGGFLAGAAIAVSLGFAECGEDCVAEGAGVITALIALPVAGGLAGRALAGNRYTLLYAVP